MGFGPALRHLSPLGRLGWLRASLGALTGIAVTVLLNRAGFGHVDGLPVIIAPLGASAVLLFMVPASPLAQPWSILGGNTLSALGGIACALTIDNQAYAAGAAVAAAIGIMSVARCLHPPGGAIALTAVVGGPAVTTAGWSFALMPVALSSAVLIAIAWLFHNVTRHSYPHRAMPISRNAHDTRDPAPQDRVGYTVADIDTVLARYDELLDVGREDLDILFRQVEAQAHRRLHGEIRCEAIMSRDVICAAPDEKITTARDRLLAHALASMPVVDENGTVVGLIGYAQLPAGQDCAVHEVMLASPYLATREMPIDELLPRLSSGHFHEAIIVDRDNRLAGLITQTDLLAALWRSHVAERVATAADAYAAAPSGQR